MTRAHKKHQRSKLRVPALGAWVRQVRESKGLTQPDIAEMTGIHKTQLSRLENGANIEAEQYERIAQALGFKNALELFRTPGDPLMRTLQRYWPDLDEPTRRALVKRAREAFEE